MSMVLDWCYTIPKSRVVDDGDACADDTGASPGAGADDGAAADGYGATCIAGACAVDGGGVTVVPDLLAIRF